MSEAKAMPRRETRAVAVGQVRIGGDAPVVVQSMTNTDTADAAATVQQPANEPSVSVALGRGRRCCFSTR